VELKTGLKPCSGTFFDYTNTVSNQVYMTFKNALLSIRTEHVSETLFKRQKLITTQMQFHVKCPSYQCVAILPLTIE